MPGRAGDWKRSSCAELCHLRPRLAVFGAVAISIGTNTREPFGVTILSNLTHHQRPKTQMRLPWVWLLPRHRQITDNLANQRPMNLSLFKAPSTVRRTLV